MHDGAFQSGDGGKSPQLRKLISASFAGWQHKIAAVVQEAVEKKELPSDTEPEPLAGFLLNSWEGALLRSQAEKSDAPLEIFLRYALDALAQNAKPKTHRKRH
jgi:TetR/AcrR family transcriptional regulator, transcriptional repressor for nem operon